MKTTNYTDIFHTVPLASDTLTRNLDGTKTNPGFPSNWIQYQSKRNTQNSKLLGAIARQDFIGIDIDNTTLFKEALTADSDTAEYVAESDLKGGHLLYQFHKEDYDILKVISKDAKKANVDIQIDNKLIYLATEANKTKTLLTEPLQNLPQTRIPQNVINLLMAHILKYQIANPSASRTALGVTVESDYNVNMLANSTLGYLLESDPYTEPMLNSILPNSLEARHPKDIKMGEGTEFMNLIRFKLSQDPSVSETNFKRFMLYINSLWDNPMEDSRILRDCNYDINNAINKHTDNPLWVYNEDWKKEGFVYSNYNKHLVEIMYDSLGPVFIEHNRITDTVSLLKNSMNTLDRVQSNSSAKQKVVKDNLLRKSQSVSLVDTPEKPRGKSYNEYKEVLFNKFKPSEGADILSGNKVVKDPRHPTYILKFLEHLILDKNNRLKLMQFIAHKHTTYEHSPLYFVFAGVGGAGKGVFVEQILKYFAGDRVQEVNLEKLQNNFNAWMPVTDYSIIDEAGEGNSKNQMAILVGEIKKLTGSSMVNAMAKYQDTGVQQRHYITPILSTNMNTKLITDTGGNDRRMVFFRCPNRLSNIAGVDEGQFIGHMIDELPHFANYLRTLDPIKNHIYRDNRSWKNKDYEEYLSVTISPIDKIVEAIEQQNLVALIEVLTDDLSISKSDIDSMFKTSKPHQEGRLLVYNTTGTLDLRMRSLFDIAETLPNLDTYDVKDKLRKHKTKVSYNTGGHIYPTQVVCIKGDYQPLNTLKVDNIEI